MISIDTNILFHAWYEPSPDHQAAREWVRKMGKSKDVAISEFILGEFYRLLRNPATTKPKPLGPKKAVNVVATYRNHPQWHLIGFSGNSRDLHDTLWKLAGKPNFAYRKLYDVRAALTMIAQGVTHFATVNTKDFKNLGFKKVWNPLDETSS